jgi:phosphoserine phosphatase
MTKILLTRHGHVEGIKPERFRGRAPLELTALGRQQAASVAARIAGSFRPRSIYTSPMSRCVATGAAIATACGVPAAICDDLNDIDYGAWQFKSFDEARALDTELFAAWFATPEFVRFPGGESLQDLVARAGNVLRMVLKQHSHDTVVLVGHDSINRGLLLLLLDQPLSAYWRVAQDPCCLNEIDIANGKIVAQRVNETRHLDPLADPA